MTPADSHRDSRPAAWPRATACGLSLREAMPTDTDFLAQVYADTRREELAVVPWTEDQKAAFLRHQFELQDAYYRQHYFGAAFFVIEAAGMGLGRLYLHRQPAELRLMDIALLHPWRGQGRGTALILDVVEHADRLGLPLSLHVEEHNPVQSLYARLGFQFKEDRGVYQFLMRPVDAGMVD